MRRVLFHFLLIGTVPLLFLLLWQVSSSIIDNKIILSTITDIVNILKSPNTSIIAMGSLIDNVTISLIRVIIGYTTAFLVAITWTGTRG